MFAKDKLVTAKDVEAVQYRSTANFPIYKCKCLDCPTSAENFAELGLAEQAAKNHAEQYRHRVRLAMDLTKTDTDIEIEIINGEERSD